MTAPVNNENKQYSEVWGKYASCLYVQITTSTNLTGYVLLTVCIHWQEVVYEDQRVVHKDCRSHRDHTIVGAIIKPHIHKIVVANLRV